MRCDATRTIPGETSFRPQIVESYVQLASQLSTQLCKQQPRYKLLRSLLLRNGIKSRRIASRRTGPFVPDFQHELVANRMGSRSAETEDYLKDPDSKNKPTRTNTRILPRIRMEFLIAQIGNEQKHRLVSSCEPVLHGVRCKRTEFVYCRASHTVGSFEGIEDRTQQCYLDRNGIKRNVAGFVHKHP